MEEEGVSPTLLASPRAGNSEAGVNEGAKEGRKNGEIGVQLRHSGFHVV